MVCSPLGSIILDALPTFSSDLAGMITAYLLYPTGKKGSRTQCLLVFGSRGEKDGYFDEEYGCKAVAVVPGPSLRDECMWVGDCHRTQVFNAEGQFVHLRISSNRTNGLAWDEKHGRLFITQWEPVGINVHTPDGTLLYSFGTRGKEKGQFRLPNGIAVNTRDNLVYIVDQGNYRVQIFT